MLLIDPSTVTRVLPEDIRKANRILDQMERERERKVSDWMTTSVCSPRGTMPQYGDFRSEWYEWEESYEDFVDDQMAGDRLNLGI